MLKWECVQRSVKPGADCRLEVPVPDGNAELSYEWHTEGGDVAFSVVCNVSDDDGVDRRRVLVPWERVESQDSVVRRQHRLTGPCTVGLRWDNSYSWLRGKDLSYLVTLQRLQPQPQPQPPPAPRSWDRPVTPPPRGRPLEQGAPSSPGEEQGAPPSESQSQPYIMSASHTVV